MTATLPRTTDQLLAAARALGPSITAARDQIEAERNLPLPLVEAMKQAGLFRILLPREFGGSDGNPLTAMRVIEEISRVDGAAGWNLMIAMEQAMFAGILAPETARAIWGPDPDAITAGSAAAAGRALAVAGGYRVSGQWPFNSGCNHARWLWGVCRVYDGDTARLQPNGNPLVRSMLMPVEQCQILDTWDTAGLRGTGSHDFTVSDVFVPEERSFFHAADRQWPADPLFKIPYVSIAAITVTSVPLGIARAAIDALIELAATKTPRHPAVPLRERAVVQADIGRAEALLRSARAFLFETVAAAWQSALAGAATTFEQRLMMRLAATHMAITAAQVVDLMYNAGGATSIYTRSPLERCFRDVHVATQHAQVMAVNFETAGQVFLGMTPSTAYI